MYSFPPLAATIDILHAVITTLITFLTPALGPAAAATGIVLLTIAVRLVLLPLGWRRARAEAQRARLTPRIRELQQRYKNNPERLRREITQFYVSEGASPLAGCLPMVAQAPAFMAVFGLFMTHDLSYTVAGLPLSAGLLDVTGPGLLVFAALFGVLLVVAWLTSRSTPTSDTPGSGVVKILPFATVGAAAVLPLAAGIYLATSTTWTYVERRTLRKIIGGVATIQ